MNNSLFNKSIKLVFQMLMSHLYGGGAENLDAAILDILEVREHKIDQSYTEDSVSHFHCAGCKKTIKFKVDTLSLFQVKPRYTTISLIVFSKQCL